MHAPEATKLMAAAETLARSLGHPYLGVEHLVLCMCEQPEGSEVRAVLDLLIPNLPGFIHQLREASRLASFSKLPAQLAVTPRLHKILASAQKLAHHKRRKKMRTMDLLDAIIVEGDSLPATLLQQYLFENQPNPHLLQAHYFRGLLANSWKNRT
ncbi:hypothetical protein DB346_16510 [Verrucomicrobia bacterium LW23]|nr:hypothetical protein DB346_16510 [Verrucomicrobia bacterium LW23]